MMRLATLITACLLSLGLPGQPPRYQEGRPLPPGEAPARVDVFGDPLPTGVLTRMGSVRLNCEDSIQSVVFAPDGKSLSALTGAREKQLWFLDVSTGKTIRQLTVPQGPREHALTPDGRLLAVRCFYQRSVDPTRAGVRNFAEIHVLDGTTGKPMWKTDPKHEFESMALSADGKLLAGGTERRSGESNDVYLWETATGKELTVLKGHPTVVKALAFSADGKRLLSASPDVKPFLEEKIVKGSVRAWELPGGKLIKQIAPGGSEHVFSPDGRSVACWDQEEKRLHLWDVDADRKIATLPSGLWKCVFSPDGRSAVTGGETQMLRLWDSATGREIRSFRGVVGSGTYPLAFSADGKCLASHSRYWGNDSSLRLWDVTRGTELRPFGGHNVDITCLAFSADGKKMISGSDDHTARVWETASGKELALHDRHQALVTAVAFSSDGRTVASGDQANVTHVWDAGTGKLLHRLPSGLGAPRQARSTIGVLNFSPDGKSLWVGSRVFTFSGRQLTDLAGELALYDTAAGKRIRSFKPENSIPLAVSPDGALSVWTGRIHPKDKTDVLLERWEEKVVVRRLDTGREVFTIATGGDRPQEVTAQVYFSPDSRQLSLHSHWLAQGFTRDELVPCHRLVEVVSGRDVVNRSSTDFPWTLFTLAGQVLSGVHRHERIIAPLVGSVRANRPSISVIDAVTEKVVGELPAHPISTNPWAVAPGGQFFASANPNHTILVWDLAQQGLKQPPGRKDVTRAELDRLWTDLSGEDAKKAFLAAAELTAMPAQSVPLLCERLKPVAGPPAEVIVGHVNALNSKQFEVRDKATLALEKMGELAEPVLRQALEGNPSLEARRRVEQVLEKLETARPSPERLRAVRAVAVLERVATPEARKHLTTLAGGAPGAWLTREAKSSLERLAARATDTPR